MGKKLLIIGSAVGIFATLGYAICLFLPLHKVYWKIGNLFDAVHMNVYSMTVHYDWKWTRACKLVQAFGTKKDLCAKDKDGESASTSVMLQDASSTWCTAAFKNAVTGGCTAMTCAYLMGIILILFTVANMIMQGVSLFLVQEYMKKPKKQYRETAFFLDLIGCVLMLVGVILYWPTAILAFDSITVAGGLGDIFFSPADSLGVTWGYVLLYFFIIIQVVSVILLGNGSNSAETREAELREQRKFMQEQELFQQATEMTSSNYGGKALGSACCACGCGQFWCAGQVTAPPNHWGQSFGQGPQGNFGAPTPQSFQNYGYGGPPPMAPQPMPMQPMQPMAPPSNMTAAPMQPAGPYF
ncbi:unnamed protein product [Durusdinium trenchii]|uniref:Uncharacterized protein n=1 Tax=Durusdinium trenchii TaxID=1381693 RepID=A0ABP0P7Z5_9DINO